MGRLAAVVAAIVLLAQGCDEGLQPPTMPWTVNSGFSGIIRFRHWPPADSVQELRLIAFPEYPSDSATILLDILYGYAVVYPQIGQPNLLLDTTQHTLFADSIRYAFTDDKTTLKVGVYNYVALAWRYGPNVFVDWRPAGVYSLGPGPFDPAPVNVLPHRTVPGIDILVDFSNPPPKPWR